MPGPLSFTPLRQETRLTIRARLEADMNAGRDPNSSSYYDTTPGTEVSDLLDLLALEGERLWDMASVDVPAASMIDFAWGTYLDAHSSLTDVERGSPVAATGEITFSGDNGTIIAVGSEVATIQTDADDEPIVFRTTTGGTIASGSVTLPVEAVDPGKAGNLAAGSLVDDLTGVTGVTAVSNVDATTGGEDEETDEEFRDKLRKAFSAARGGGTVDDLEAWALEYPGVGHVRVTPLWNGEGTARVVVTDANNDPVSKAIEDGLQADIDPISAQTTLTEKETLPTGTINVVSTEGFASSGRIYVGGIGPITYTGKTSNTFTGCTGGAGEAANGSTVQQHGLGKGKGPPGLMVSVDTAATLTVTVEANVTTDDDYSLNGSNGTIDVTPDVVAALGDYVNSLPPGGEDPPGLESPAGSGIVNRLRCAAKILEVEGLYNIEITSLKLNGAATDLTVGALQVPTLGTVTLT